MRTEEVFTLLHPEFVEGVEASSNITPHVLKPFVKHEQGFQYLLKCYTHLEKLE
jgi:hypothetical protein